jgi:hypothetical protein
MTGLSVGAVLHATAVLESLTAAAFILAPSSPMALLFGAPLDTRLDLLVARFVGGPLLSLGIACWCAGNDPASRAASGMVTAMLLYDAFAAALLAYAGLWLGLIGIALWPAVFIHLALAVASIMALQKNALQSTTDRGQGEV